MSNEPKGVVWWKTVSGVLTATAAMITAVAGLLVALQQAGVFERDAGPSSDARAVPPAAEVTPTGAAAPGETTAGSARVLSAARPRDTELRVGPIVYSILATRLETYSDSSLALRFSMRFTNVEIAWGVALGPQHFRLLVDDVPLAPRETFIGVVDYQSAKEGDVFFTLPITARDVVLQLGEVGKEVRRVPIDLRVTGP